MSRKLPTFLEGAEPEQLLRGTHTERDRVLLMTMLYQGLRVSELCHLLVEQIDFGRKILWVREGKGKKDRCLPIPTRFLPILRGWVGPRRSGPVFPSRQGGGPMTPRAVQLLIKRAAFAAGLREADVPRRVTPHKLRHAFASRLIERGADINAVKELLGHASLITTTVYLHASPEHLRNCMEI